MTVDEGYGAGPYNPQGVAFFVAMAAVGVAFCHSRQQ